MQLNDLEYIVTIAEEGSISKAAQKLYIGQSGLSQFLSKYESDLNTKLFTRTGSGVRPTIPGTIFIRNAREILQQFRRVQSEIKEVELINSGSISFGISSFRGSALIPPVLERFRLTHPTIQVHIHEHDSAILEKKIAAGELDIALIALPEEHEALPKSTIMRDEVCLVANRSHPVMQYAHYGESHSPWIDLKNTEAYEYLLSNRATVLGNIAHTLFERSHIQPPCFNEDLTAGFALAMASQGLGLAFTYKSCAIPKSDVEYFSIGLEKYYVDLVLIFPPDGYRNRSNKAFEEMIRDFYNDSVEKTVW